MDKDHSAYTGMKPAGGHDDSELDPFEIEFRAEYRDNRGPREPFVNAHGVVIGDHEYVSNDSPLEQWSTETDPSTMSGDQWVHPYKDIGFRTSENRDLFERGISPASGLFMHPTHETARMANSDLGQDEEEDEGEAFHPVVPEVLDEP